MNVQLLQQFDRISEVPNAVAQLRGLILNLAVRGRLATQNSDDEPASELLKRIQVENARLLKDTKIKAQGMQAPVHKNEIGFQLPPNWVPARVGNLLTVIRGASPRPKGDPKYFSGERTSYHWVKISDIRKHSKDGVLYDTDEFLTEAGMKKSVLLPRGSLIVTNSATIGVPVILGFDGGCIHDGYLAFPYFPSELSKEFFFILFQTLQAYAISKARGMAQLNLNTGLVREFPLGLPPLEEQRRIVAKVDELMALCDRLEAAQAERERRRDRVVAASLQHLSQPADDAEQFRCHVSFHLRLLARSTTRSEHIQQLRKAILNLAVRGALVPQSESEAPAAALLEQIRVEKVHLVKQGGIKKDKKSWDGLPKEPPYAVPPRWEWCRLQDVFEISRGGSPRPAGDPRYFGGTIPWITVREITKNSCKYLVRTEGGLTDEGALRSRFVNPDDLLLTNSGATLGVPKISRIRACLNDGVAVLRLFHSVPLNDFAYLYLQSQTEAFRSVNQGMGQPNLNTPIIAGWFLPMPPLAEQDRIVSKVDQLMTVCDRLEAQLSQSQAVRGRLLEAVLRDALESEMPRIEAVV